MSLDEARSGFATDASATTSTNNYLLVGDNAYGYSTASTNLASGSIGDLDTYKIILDIGSSYTVVSTGATLFGSPVVVNDNFAILNRYGVALVLSVDYGAYSGYTFTALDSIYYLQNYSDSVGYYGLRLGNNTITETNSIGQEIFTNQTYSAALDYTSDVDIYSVNLVANTTYYFGLISAIPDIYIDVEYQQVGVANLVSNGGGLFYFTALTSGYHEFHISSNSFVNTGAYTLLTNTIRENVIPPTVTAFSPSDEATAAAVDANIVLTFSEAIARGTGNIVLKTSAGTVVATYDAATSTNLSISGSTLTINPTADLGYSTAYKVEFAAGSIKDLAGYSYVGTTSYNFTTTAPLVTVAVSAAVSESGSANLVYTLSRTGDTSSALTVNIDLAGTAGSADYTVGPSAWTKLLGSSKVDVARALTTGLDGSIYVAGYTEGALDGQTNNGGTDAFLTKYSADGTKAWTQLLGSAGSVMASAITTGLDGSIFVGGRASGALDGQTNNGNYDAFLTKYSTDGSKDPDWTKLLGSSGNDEALALTTGLDGSIYISGFTEVALDGQTYSSGRNAFLTKYSTDGTKLWTKLLVSIGTDEAYALTTGLDGSIYVSGSTFGALDGQTNNGSTDVFLTKYSADGTKAWTRLLGSSSSEGAYALTTGLDGSIYVSGNTTGTLDGQTNNGGFDAFLTKYSADGTKAWTKLLGTSGTDYARALTTGLDGSIYVSGTTEGALDGLPNNGSNDAFLTKYSADGSKAWTKLLGTSGSEYARALTTGLDGSIYVSGETYGALDGQSNNGSGDVFLTKFYTTPPITFAAGSSTATLILAPISDSVLEGNETVVVTVLAGTGYTLGSTFSATGTIDDTPPTLAITSSASALKAGETATITFTFSEAPTGFAASDVTTTGGTMGTPTVSSTNTKVYTATFTPTASLASGTASITVASASYTDAAGNSGGAGTTPIISIDTLAPTVTTFSPVDEATGVAIAANIVLTFSEALALGTGNMVLKTAAGLTVATYSAATSTNLSISGSTLTINPTADLGYSTGYAVEFAAGSIKDLAGNSYAGTTSYNFTSGSRANTLPTGSVTISGTPTQGQALTVANTLVDPDGIPVSGAAGAVSYQWQRSTTSGYVSITGATGSTYMLTQADVGKTITVTASYTDAFSTAESKTSSATTAVANIDDAATGSLTVAGATVEGSVLAATLSGLDDVDGAIASTAWQWQRANNGATGWSDIVDANTATYNIAADQSEVGKFVRVRAITTDAVGGTTSFFSSADGGAPGFIQVKNLVLEKNTLSATTAVKFDIGFSATTINGSKIQGALIDLVYDYGSVASDVVTSVSSTSGSKVWWDVVTNLSGSTSNGKIALAGASGVNSVIDATGKTLSVNLTVNQLVDTFDIGIQNLGDRGVTQIITADGRQYLIDELAPAVANANDLPAGSVTISGTPTQGQTLTAANTLADADGLGTISYQWWVNEVGAALDNGFSGTREQEHPLIKGTSNDTTAATPDRLGSGWLTASLASSTDVDYFKIDTTSAALIKIDLSNLLITDTKHWSLALLDGNGDYLRSLTSTVSGAPLVDGTSNTGTSLKVTGLTADVPVGSRFSFVTSAADSTIYTVSSATPISGGGSTLTLTTALPSGLAASTALAFDPAQTLAGGATTSFTGQVSAAGTYFVKVAANSWTQADYNIRATVLKTIESTGENGSKDEAIASATSDQNRPVEKAWMTGALSDANDHDFWVFSTATMTGSLTLDFSAASGSNTAPEWDIKLTQWTGDQPLTNVQGTAISGTAGASRSFTIDFAKYTTATTFVVDVSKASGVTVDTGAYKLRLSGATLDLNDSPLVTIDGVTSSQPYDQINTGVTRSVKAGANSTDSKVALSTLFTATDADAGQTVANYKVVLSKATGETATLGASIQLIESNGTTSTTFALGSTASLTAAQMAKAYVVPGSVTGNLSLALQAFDSSGALDNSGASSVMVQTLRVVSANVGTAITGATSSTYVLTQAEVGKAVTVIASYTDAFNTAESKTSSATTAVISVDTLAPTVATFSPADEATNTAINANIVLTFSEAIALGTGNIVLKTAAGVTVATYSAATSTNLGISGSTLTINPTADLGYSTGYSVEFSAGSIKDLVGNSYAGTTSYNFTTMAAPDTAAPTLSSSTPADNASAVLAGANLTLTFNEAIKAGAGNLVLTNTTNAADTRTVSVSDASQVSISGSQLTLNPTADLLGGAHYALTLGAGVVQDLAGNDYAGISLATTLDFTVAAASAKPTLSGIAYDWKNHMLLQDVAIAVKGGSPAEGANAPIQFKALVWDASGRASVEVWTHATTAVQNAGFDLEITNASGITFTAGTLPSTSTGGTGWTLITNASGTNLTVGGFANDSTAAIAAGNFKLGTITFAATAQRADLHLLSGDVGSASASAYGLSMARTSTSATGAYSISTLEPGSYDIAASRAVTDIGNAITSADALAALKMAVGLNPNPDPDGAGPLSALIISPYQFMVADVIGTDGRVTSADALAILKMAVKLPTAPTKEWLFVEESRDFWNETTGQFTLNRNSTGWDHSISTNLQAGATSGTVNLVGVLKGDVNGSWAAPAGSTDLDTRVRHQMTQVVDSYRARFKLATTKGSTGRLESVF